MRIQAFYTKSQPQILLEEMVHYFTQSQEFFEEKKAEATIAAIPYGERSVTGVIQALGFSYLQGSKNSGFIIAAHSEDVTEITTTNAKKRGDIRGHTTSIAHKIIKKQQRKVNNKLMQTNKAISYQLPFHVLSSNTPIIPLLLPMTLTTTQQKEITKVVQDHNFGFILSVPGIKHSASKDYLQKDKELITDIQNQTIKRKKKSNKELYALYKIAQKMNNNLTLSGYTNVSNGGLEQDTVTSYISLIG